MKFILSIILLSVVMAAYSESAIPSAEDVIGLSEKELYEKYPETNKPSGSFLILVSKNLHPYHAPSDHVFLRYGKAYLVFELNNGKVINLHKVHG
jgi:hypothetical protein